MGGDHPRGGDAGGRGAARRAAGRPQLQAAIAAAHSTAETAETTDWRRMVALYAELLRHEPSPVVEAHRAVAVAMAEGPAAGLVILDALSGSARLARWPQLHVARADLLARLERTEEARRADREALALEPPAMERSFITRRIRELG